jgi:hypothetical protein
MPLLFVYCELTVTLVVSISRVEATVMMFEKPIHLLDKKFGTNIVFTCTILATATCRSVIDEDTVPASEKIYTGSIINMSCAGMCLHVSDPVAPGQKITINRENQFYVNGTVVWCNELGGRLHPYKIGLQFV